ncbi:MAG: hypothetical protein NW226_20035 [Microscillaceae bacterium]|nr:hypothetical protein [Microscillaceae bacterium]
MKDIEVFYENEYIVYSIDRSKALFEVIWKDTTFLREEVFKEIIIKQKESTLFYRPRKVLIDSTFFDFAIDPSLQKWFDDQIFSATIKSGIQKVGIVISKDLFAQVSVEQTMEEGQGIMHLTRYFRTYQEARYWLLN